VFSLEAFASLKELILNKCPPSTISDLYSFRKKLTKLEIICSGVPELSKLLAPIKSKYLKTFQPMILNDLPSPMKPLYAWDHLTTLRLINCGITRLDASLHYLPALTHLDVSYNDLSHIIHLQDCHQLRVLNISHNRISVLSNLIWVIPGIERLNLSHNQVESLDGLGQLLQLERIDLSANKINDFHEMQSLSQLKLLTHLYLLGNAIASKPNYRLHVISQFLNDCSLDGRELPFIDGKMLSPKESYTLRWVLPPSFLILLLPPFLSSLLFCWSDAGH
jgi:Leucine-rich repeat (LRR) protein